MLTTTINTASQRATCALREHSRLSATKRVLLVVCFFYGVKTTCIGRMVCESIQRENLTLSTFKMQLDCTAFIQKSAYTSTELSPQETEHKFIELTSGILSDDIGFSDGGLP